MKKIIILLHLCALPSLMVAQTLTLDECTKMALEYNKSLQSAIVQEQKQTSDIKAVRANFYPKLDITALDCYKWGTSDITLPMNELTHTMLTQMAPSLIQSGLLTQEQLGGLVQMPIQDPSIELKVKNLFLASAQLTQPIYVGGKITAAYQMTKIGKQIANDNIRLTKSQVIINTTEAYILAVKTKMLIDVANSYKKLLDELQKNVDAAVVHGLKTKNDALKVQVKQNEVQLNLLKAENAFRLACMNLCQVIGIDINSNINVDENSLSKSLYNDNTQSFSITNRPEYSILNNKTRIAEKKVKLTRSDYLPNIAALGGYSYTNGIELAGKKLFKGEGAFSVGVSVKIPVLSYFTEGTHKIRSAKAEQQIAQYEQEELNEKMTLEITQSKNNYDESVLEVTLCKKSTLLAEENMKTSQQQYEVGLEPLSDLLETQVMWQTAKANEVEALYKKQLSLIRLLKATGKL